MGSDYVLIPAATFMVTAALLGYVLIERVRNGLFSGMVAVLASILCWIGGMLIGVVSPSDSIWAGIGVVVHFAGVCSVATTFLLLAMRYSHVGLIEEHPRGISVALSIPSALCFGIVLTNPLHGMFGAAFDGSFFVSDDSNWRGPLYPLVPMWVYAATLSGLAMCLWRSFLTHDAKEKRRLVLLTLAAMAPLIGYLAQNAGLVSIPREVPVATLCLTASALVVVIGIARFGFLDTSLLPLRSVIDQIDDGLLMVDCDGLIIETNRAAPALVSARVTNLVGLDLETILGALGDDGELYSKLWQPDRAESWADRLEARGRTFDVSFGWLHGSRGHRIGGFVVLGDRTEQQNHQRLRHRSQKLESMGVLLAGIAHEINNPLAYLRANLGHMVSMIGELEKSPQSQATETAETIGELAETVDDSLEGLERIAMVVARTRSLSPRSGDPAPAAVDLPDLLDECIDLARRYTRSDVTVEAIFSPDVPSMEGFRDRLQQVFLNLLVNAQQALGEQGGRIRVSTRLAGGWVEVRVEDDGPGVPEALRDQIFDPFFTTKDPDEGMGLGLSIVHDIVEEHCGEFALEESDLGGAAFCIRMPVCAADANSSAML